VVRCQHGQYPDAPSTRVLTGLTLLFTVHMLQIGVFAVAFALAERWLNLGAFAGEDGGKDIPAKMLDVNRRADGIPVRGKYSPLHLPIYRTHHRPSAPLNQRGCIPAFATAVCWTPTVNMPFA